MTPPIGEVRERIWTAMMRAHVAAYPLPVHGHHPNFRGASDAAERLVGRLQALGMAPPGATAICFPDHVLHGVRKRLLERGVDVVVPAKHGTGFRLLRSSAVRAAAAASIAGAERHGENLETAPAADLAIVACVALACDGRYVRKGFGFRLPERLATLPTATVIHPLQLVEQLPESDGDVDLYSTPAEVVQVGK
jgi:5-formyltetrahydrofolate cyclo-ligase